MEFKSYLKLQTVFIIEAHQISDFDIFEQGVKDKIQEAFSLTRKKIEVRGKYQCFYEFKCNSAKAFMYLGMASLLFYQKVDAQTFIIPEFCEN